MIQDKRIENEPFYVPAYTPYSISKPKLHEYGYFTDDLRVCNKLEECDNLNYLDCELYYEYGELIDYDGLDCEHPYRGAFEDTTWDETCYYENNYAFYIPESSIPKEKREWYRRWAINNT